MTGRRKRTRTAGNARRHRAPGFQPPQVYLLRHMQVALLSLGRLFRSPLPTLMTAAVIGISLALPSGMFLLLENLQRLGSSWDGQVSLSVYLRAGISGQQSQLLAGRIREWPETASVRLITPEQGLEEFGARTGLTDVLAELGENPLPPVLIITPTAAHSTAAAASDLRGKLASLPEAELAQLDLAWVQRLAAMLDIARRGSLIVGGLLALGVVLVIGNTIRLEIQNRRPEIVVTKLIGGSNAFVRRPFLYTGFWYGLLGGILAWLVVEAGFWLLAEPVARLAGLYQSDFGLLTRPLQSCLILLVCGSLLGLLGSWLAVGRHLSAVRPE